VRRVTLRGCVGYNSGTRDMLSSGFDHCDDSFVTFLAGSSPMHGSHLVAGL